LDIRLFDVDEGCDGEKYEINSEKEKKDRVQM